jgi:multimeric flavodoxin WrbA
MQKKMSKNVLVLSSSPRRNGNSDLLCDQFISGAQEAGHHAEKIFLKDKEINYCTGCGTCIDKGKSCPQKDDMAEVLDKMIAADVIVMATPVYFYTMCAQMKTLIDRTCARYTEISNKEFYFIVTAADNSKPAMKRTLEEFRGFTSCLDGPKEKGVIYGTGAWNKGEIKKSEAMNLASEMGKKA